MYTDDLLEVAERHSVARRISLATLGTYAANDGSFFNRLRAGRVTLRRADHVMQWLSDHWIEGVEWPARIPRPEPSPTNREVA